jgi:flagellar biosynthesis GTPase FlhF
MGVEWGVEGIRHHSPDVAVFVGLSRDPRPTGLLDLKAFGGSCELIVEVVSPSTRVNDVVTKFDHYFRVGVRTYVIIDQEQEGGPRRLRAYRRRSLGFAEIESDPQDRIDLPLLGLTLGMRDDRVVCFDLRTGQELGDYSRVVEQLQEEKRKLEQADQAREAAEQAIGEQIEARQKAERQTAAALGEADKQRQEADRQRQEADKQRQDAEKQREEADTQRQEADKQRQEADRQRLAREELEKQKQAAEEQAAKTIRELQEKLRLLQGGDPAAANPTA